MKEVDDVFWVDPQKFSLHFARVSSLERQEYGLYVSVYCLFCKKDQEHNTISLFLLTQIQLALYKDSVYLLIDLHTILRSIKVSINFKLSPWFSTN